jgi:Transcriptional Coactivator p15 (PC4)
MSKLTEAVEISKFWRNRKGDAVIVRLSPYEGHDLIDIRSWYTSTYGKLAPGKGLSCAVRHLPELAAALNRALVEARTLGLIDGEAK